MKNLPLKNTFIPSSAPSKKLMIVLHGRGDSAEGFSWLPSYFNMDDMNYLLLNAPYDYYGGYSWYDLPPKQFEGITYSSAVLSEVLDTLFEEEFEASQSFIFGFSQGSLLVFEFAARYEKMLAGYIAISGYIYDAENLLKEMNPILKNANWICTHGTHDDVLPYGTSKSQVEVLQSAGFTIEFKSYDKAHNIDKKEIDMLVKWVKSKA
ncbi:MAG: serine esterase [Sulfurovum sp.]|nr:serine esterase [Sulfurovum sp.]